MNTYSTLYKQHIIPTFLQHFHYTNIYSVPKLVKITLNSGLGVNAQNVKYLHAVINEIRLITGQHPILLRVKQSNANFKIRQGMYIGLKVTLRRSRMYTFLEKLIKLIFPRIRDFQGFSITQFDPNGNYNFGISDQLLFPEIDYDHVDKQRGYNITITTTATTPNEGLLLLKEFGFPFKKY